MLFTTPYKEDPVLQLYLQFCISVHLSAFYCFFSHFGMFFLGLVLVQNLNIQPFESISLDFHVFRRDKVNVI